MKRIISLVIWSVCLFGGAISAQEATPRKGMTLTLGMGPQFYIHYPSDLAAVLLSLEKPGVQKVEVNFNLNVAFFVTQAGTEAVPVYWYVDLGMNGFARRLQDSISFLQVNNYVYGVGFSAQNGISQTKVIVGPAIALIQMATGNRTSPVGFGVSWTTELDLNANGGFGLGISLTNDFQVIDQDFYWASGLSLVLSYL